LDSGSVQAAIRLDAGALDSETLAAIEHAVMDCGSVRGAGHQSVKGVHLAHEVTFSEPADRRVTRHRADLCWIVTDKGDSSAASRCRGGCFGAGVATANHDDIK
jgi:hypothetical protein